MNKLVLVLLKRKKMMDYFSDTGFYNDSILKKINSKII